MKTYKLYTYINIYKIYLSEIYLSKYIYSMSNMIMMY